MGDLIGFEGYLNTTAPVTLAEYKVQWKGERRYRDFEINNNYREKCNYPRFWPETSDSVYPAVKGCYDESVPHPTNHSRLIQDTNTSTRTQRLRSLR